MLVIRNAYLCGVSGLALAIGLGATGALAADATAAADAGAAVTAAQPGAVVGELVVVAQKREQNIESVPIAITAFSAKQRDIMGLRTTQDLANFTPGLNYYSVADEAYIRGIGRNTVNLATAAGVATYYNGFYYGANASIALQKDTLFIANVEVDNGPQNTLHGSNSDGGVINYISQKPTSSFYAEGRMGVADYGYIYGEAVVSGPINDHWKFRVGGNYSSQGDGFFHNLTGLPNEGGFGPQANGGRWHYWEAQLQGSYDHFDIWGMVSSADYNTNFHAVEAFGNYDAYTFTTAGSALYPSTTHGLCALDNNSAIGCLPSPGDPNPQPVVLGSATSRNGVTANQFPGNNPANVNPYNYLDTTPSSNDVHNNIALTLTATYHFAGVDLEYIGGYQQFNQNLNFSAIFDPGILTYQLKGNPSPIGAALTCGAIFGAAGPGVVAACTAAAQQPLTIAQGGELTHFEENDQDFSNEVDLISTAKGPFQFLLGAYQYHEHFDQPIDLGCYPFQSQLQSPLLTITSFAPFRISPTPPRPNPDSCVFSDDGRITYDDLAGFAHASYDITPQFQFAGGVRYTWDHKYGFEENRFLSFDNIFTAPMLGAFTPSLDLTPAVDAPVIATPVPGVAPRAFINPVTGFAFRFLHDSWSAVTGDATLNWKPDSSTLGYLRYARGYKAGGFNSGALSPVPATKPEYVDDFEGGIKKTWGSQFLLNVDAFYYNWLNDQVPIGVLVGGTVLQEFTNIPQSRLFGIEGLAQWRPIDPLTLSLTYAYENSRIINMQGICIQNPADLTGQFAPPGRLRGCTGGTENITGNVLPQVTPNKVTFNAQYVFHFDPGSLTLAGTFTWWDATFDSLFEDPLTLAPSYDLVNFSAYWEDAKDRYTLRAFVNNAFNQLGYNDATAALNAPATVAETTPGARNGTRGLIGPISFGAEVQVRFR
jgi:iron complex outermembrane receptor protein